MRDPGRAWPVWLPHFVFFFFCAFVFFFRLCLRAFISYSE